MWEFPIIMLLKRCFSKQLSRQWNVMQSEVRILTGSVGNSVELDRNVSHHFSEFHVALNKQF